MCVVHLRDKMELEIGGGRGRSKQEGSNPEAKRPKAKIRESFSVRSNFRSWAGTVWASRAQKFVRQLP